MIRGSGESGFNRQEKFLKRLDKKLHRKGIDPDEIHFEFADWYSPLQIQQEAVLDRMKAAGIKLRARITRKLIITNIGDLINYGGKPNLPGFAYVETHKLVHKSMLALKARLAPEAPLIILASSMGTEIINNYIWDRQHPKEDPDPLGASGFEQFNTLTGLFTFGSNIPIFAASHNIDSLEPIEFPSENLKPHLRTAAVWENYYDKNDSMGYPIKPLNDKYGNCEVKDIQINIGGLLSFWNLLSHFGYWKSRKLVKRIATYIDQVMHL